MYGLGHSSTCNILIQGLISEPLESTSRIETCTKMTVTKGDLAISGEI